MVALPFFQQDGDTQTAPRKAETQGSSFTFAVIEALSGNNEWKPANFRFGSKADIGQSWREVRYGPIGDIVTVKPSTLR